MKQWVSTYRSQTPLLSKVRLIGSNGADPLHFLFSTLENMVGIVGFEPTTPCSQSRCATRLR